MKSLQQSYDYTPEEFLERAWQCMEIIKDLSPFGLDSGRDLWYVVLLERRGWYEYSETDV